MSEVIQVFEHSFLFVSDDVYDKNGKRKAISHDEFDQFVKNHDENALYYDIYNRKIKFKSYVGILKIRNLQIEVLPKIAESNEDVLKWKGVLGHMLKVTYGLININSNEIHLKEGDSSLLDIFFKQFLISVNNVVHTGLSKSYVFNDRNTNAFKGKLLVSKDVVINSSNKVAAYCRIQEYSIDNSLNRLLKAALELILKITSNTSICNECRSLLVAFDSVSSLKGSDLANIDVPSKYHYYSDAITLALLILNNKSVNLNSGRIKCFSLMFDMNRLFEDYLFKILKVGLRESGYRVERGCSPFWNNKVLKPDILIIKDNRSFIIDAKWKKFDRNPSDADLRQIFAYNEIFGSVNGFLVYPAIEREFIISAPYRTKGHSCGIATVTLFDDKGRISHKAVVQTILNILVLNFRGFNGFRDSFQD